MGHGLIGSLEQLRDLVKNQFDGHHQGSSGKLSRRYRLVRDGSRTDYAVASQIAKVFHVVDVETQ